MPVNVYSKFETELSVRPDDIDLYQHVHSTRYLDYVLAARFIQMERDYGMSMQAFAARGFGWFMTAASIQYKRPLGLGDKMLVRCWIDHFTDTGCRVSFEIEKQPTRGARLRFRRMCAPSTRFDPWSGGRLGGAISLALMSFRPTFSGLR
jgi:YbgC/YbaW family acyl-CoA thioester hydrolase